MSINKIIITKGIYSDKELRLLVSFDENDNPVDLINLDVTKVGELHLASVEKVLNDIDACIVKLDSGDKGFIENRKLVPEAFIERHSEAKLVCQADKFYVQISQDRKGVKPYSCNFIVSNDQEKHVTFIDYYLQSVAEPDAKIVTDLEEYAEANGVLKYEDKDISLWNLYGLTSLLDKVTSKVIHMSSGSNIIIEPTEAMTIIDVNSSKNYGKYSAMETNIEALHAVCHQLRLRSISGIILVDFLKVSKEEEAILIDKANDLFKEDISKVTVHGFSNLGLMEITRSRIISPFML